MVFLINQRAVSVAFSLTAGIAMVTPGLAMPIASPSSEPIPVSQLNRETHEDIPYLLTEDVRGTITDVDGSRITLETEEGETRSYVLPPENENRDGLNVGSIVVLEVDRGIVVAYYVAMPVRIAAPVVVRQREVVQETRPEPVLPPRPAPAPRPAAVQPAPAPQPVRGLW